jgi:hypothetical protein
MRITQSEIRAAKERIKGLTLTEVKPPELPVGVYTETLGSYWIDRDDVKGRPYYTVRKLELASGKYAIKGTMQWKSQTSAFSTLEQAEEYIKAMAV